MTTLAILVAAIALIVAIWGRRRDAAWEREHIAHLDVMDAIQPADAPTWKEYLASLKHSVPHGDECPACATVWAHVLATPGFREALDEGIADMEAGRYRKWADVMRELRDDAA